jgi:aldehyde dehydrogenase (NAD+)
MTKLSPSPRRCAESVKLGDPTQARPHIGPVRQQGALRQDPAPDRGGDRGRRDAGHRRPRPRRPGSSRGYYVKPTIFANVNNDMTIAREEIFGPVLAMIPFKDEADAIAIANDTPYGLAGLHADAATSTRARRVARQPPRGQRLS